MSSEAKVKTLQMVYAGALADATLRFDRQGVKEAVEAEKRAEQLASGKMRAAQMGIDRPDEVFLKLKDLFGCADWRIEKLEEDGFSATAEHCLLSAMAKKMNTSSPCKLYCLDPIEGMVKGLKPDIVFEVKSTCYEGSRCLVKVY